MSERDRTKAERGREIEQELRLKERNERVIIPVDCEE